MSDLSNGGKSWGIYVLYDHAFRSTLNLYLSVKLLLLHLKMYPSKPGYVKVDSAFHEKEVSVMNGGRFNEASCFLLLKKEE